MGLLSRLFGGRAPSSEPDLTIARSREGLKVLTAAHDSSWGLGRASWETDLDAGTITFRTQGGHVAVAPVQIVGAFNTADHTWLWGWHHPDVQVELAADARVARDFGAKYALDRYTTRKLKATEADAWEFAAVACHLAGARRLSRPGRTCARLHDVRRGAPDTRPKAGPPSWIVEAGPPMEAARPLGDIERLLQPCHLRVHPRGGGG